MYRDIVTVMADCLSNKTLLSAEDAKKLSEREKQLVINYLLAERLGLPHPGVQRAVADAIEGKLAKSGIQSYIECS